MLNLSNYTSVWNDNFTQGSMPANMGVVWGNADEFSYSNQGLTLTSDGAASGFLTADSSAASGNGYGLYQVTLTMPQNQANGAYVCLWPGSNVWPGPEIDLVEQWNGQPFMTVHWEGAGDSNQYQSLDFTANLSNPTTLAMDWERGSLTYYVNGQQVVQYTSGGSIPIPLDYADGGQNEAFGVGNVGAAGVTMTISNMSYSTLKPTGGSAIALSAPGTVQEASVGAGVNVTETVTATGGLTSVYEAVFNSANQAEGGWTLVNLTNGSGSFTAHFAHSGDYVKAQNSTTSPTVTATSAAITITDPSGGKATAIGISAPGTVAETSPGAGANVTETFTAQGFSTVYEAVFTSANVAEEGWQAVSLNGSGVGTAVVHFEHSGDYVVAVDNTSNYTISGYSSAVTLADKPADLKLIGDNLYANSAAGTVIGTLSATSPDPLSFSLRHDPNNLFSVSGNQLVLASALPASPPASYTMSLIATDTVTGLSQGRVLTVDVNAAKAMAAITAANLGAATPAFAAAQVLGGAGVTIAAGAGGDTVTFGAGNATVQSGGGADDFVWHAGSGLDIIQGFGSQDTLTFDQSLQGSLHTDSVAGGTRLSFGDASHGVLLAGVWTVAASQIHWA